MRSYLGDADVEALFETYDGRAPCGGRPHHLLVREGTGDDRGRRRCAERVLPATQGIRGGGIAGARSGLRERRDLHGSLRRPVDPRRRGGARSFIAFDDGSERERTLDGLSVPGDQRAPAADVDLTWARRLGEIRHCVRMPVRSVRSTSSRDLAQQPPRPRNPYGRRNADVVRPWLNGDRSCYAHATCGPSISEDLSRSSTIRGSTTEGWPGLSGARHAASPPSSAQASAPPMTGSRHVRIRRGSCAQRTRSTARDRRARLLQRSGPGGATAGPHASRRVPG